MKVLMDNCREHEDLWLLGRKKHVTASEVPIIMGLTKWLSPKELWLEKTGKRPLARRMTEAQSLGVMLEDAILNHVEETEGLKFDRQLFAVEDSGGLLAATFDGIDQENGVVCEVKTTGLVGRADRAFYSSDVPPHVMAQVQTQLIVSGAKYALVYALVAGKGLVRWRVTPEEKWALDIRHAAEKFWECVKSNTPPDGVEFPTIEVDSEEAPAVIPEEMFTRYALRKQERDIAEEEFQRAKRELIKALGNKGYGMSPSGDSIRRTVVVSHRVDTKTLRKEFPDIAEKMLKESQYERVTISLKPSAEETL